ncbi:hypothetical protein [Halarcobacter ebronensis]|uniref:Lipoprotein n=1 Tax=Halarcobacter ebronensis TaxID=1462615 RepID=A0A4V1M0D5_9BACT|nr:hypothetical protein [Halarcobacter ebronensis]QKF81322.1 hypothetical protein AEBR_0823 [Halarcobacter ebronensis]RXK04887.1 hypothetical protein CRV07_09870 [Halarcobacter ebronensis]
MKKILVPILFSFMALFITGCSIDYTASIPNFKQEYQTKKRIVIVPPSVKMYEISTGGVEEEISDWSKLAMENMQKSIINNLPKEQQLKYEVINYSTLPEFEKELITNSNNLLFRISPSIHQHALKISVAKFDEKIENFDYTIGDVLSNISETGDIYLFLNAEDRVQTSGKKAAEVTKAIIGALLFGVGVGDIGGITFSSVAMVDAKTGKLMWYNYYISKGAVDLREEKGTDEVVKVLFNGLQSKI